MKLLTAQKTPNRILTFKKRKERIKKPEELFRFKNCVSGYYKRENCSHRFFNDKFKTFWQ